MQVETGTGAGEPGLTQAAQGFGQAVEPPVEHVVVRQAAGIDASGLQAGDVGRMQAIVHGLTRPGPIGSGDGGLEIDDAQIRLQRHQQGQRLSPGIGGCHRRRDRTVASLHQRDVVTGIAHERLVQGRITVVGHALIQAAAEHHIAAEQQPQG